MILLIDNRVDINHTAKSSLTDTLINAFPDALVATASSNTTIPWERVRCILLSGSHLRLSETSDHPVIVFANSILRQSLRRDIPAFGICFGCQLMAGYIGCQIASRGRHIPIHRTYSRMTGSVMYFNHYDGIYGLPPGASMAYIHPGPDPFVVEFRWKKWIGIQWHPEKTDGGIAWLHGIVNTM